MAALFPRHIARYSNSSSSSALDHFPFLIPRLSCSSSFSPNFSYHHSLAFFPTSSSSSSCAPLHFSFPITRLSSASSSSAPPCFSLVLSVTPSLYFIKLRAHADDLPSPASDSSILLLLYELLLRSNCSIASLSLQSDFSLNSRLLLSSVI